MTHFVSTRCTRMISQQTPRLTLTGSDKGLVLTARVHLITKLHVCHMFIIYTSNLWGCIFVCSRRLIVHIINNDTFRFYPMSICSK